MIRAAILAGIIALAAPSAAAAPSPPPRPDGPALLATAAETYRAARELHAHDPAAATAQFRLAAAQFAEAIDTAPARTSAVYTATAAAHLMAGDYAPAILFARRALLLNSGDATARDVLERARSNAAPLPPPVPRSTLGAALDLTARRMSPRARFDAALTLAAVAVLAAAAAVLSRRLRPLWLVSGASGLAAIAAACSLAADHLDTVTASTGVVLSETPGYSGPDDLLHPRSFPDPVPAAAEVRRLDTDGDWSLIELGDGRQTWIRSASMSLLRPARAERTAD